MRKYRVWISVSVKNQRVNNIVLRKNEYHTFINDIEAEKWTKVKSKGFVEHIQWFTSASYAVLKEDGTYITGRYTN